MSYSIVRKTRVVQLSDGSILHLSLHGCNNDDAGRTNADFVGRIFESESDYTEWANSYMKSSVPYNEELGNFDLKIGSRPKSWYDYGKHLLRALKNKTSWKELKKSSCLHFITCSSVEVTADDGKVTTYTPQEWSNVFYDVVYSNSRTRIKKNVVSIYDEKEFFDWVEKNGMIGSFYVA